MSTEENKAVIRKFVRDVKNRQNPAVAMEILSPNYTHHFHMPGEKVPAGIPGTLRVGEVFGKAFPEIKVNLDVLIAEGDYVLERSSVEAVHGGEFAGVSATGQTVTWTENHLYHMQDGKIVEHWPEADILGVLEQLGALG